MKRKNKRASTKICDPAACHHCTYIGEGDFMCDNHPDEAVVLVISDWDPTEYLIPSFLTRIRSCSIPHGAILSRSL